MSKPIRRVRRSADDWRLILARFKRSGQTQRDFCQGEGVALASFLRWQKRLGSAGAPSAASRKESPFEFDRSFLELAGAASSATWTIELELPGGGLLRVRP